jgi:SagB-type dehydrogenase family enzyme
VSIFFSADFDDIDIFSNRGYRYAHLNVGLLSENVYLTATALKLGVRGIGNFFDDNINSFFGVRDPQEKILGGVIVGRY